MNLVFVVRLVLLLTFFVGTNIRAWTQNIDSIVVFPSRDNTIYQRNISNSNGAGEFFIAGTTGSPYFNRALIRFELFQQLPANTIVTNAKLTLYLAATSGLSSSYSVNLHKLSQDWGEGPSNAGTQAGQGAPAASGDATWAQSFFPGTNWLNGQGGNFNPIASGSQLVDQPGFYQWTSPGILADIQQWISNPDSNFGWLLKTDEGASFQAKRFASRENQVIGNRPRLTIYYTIAQPNKKPVVSINSPLNNSIYNAGQNIQLQANASDSDGVITKVKFYAHGSEFLVDSTAPYGLSSSEVEPGNYVVTATAYDNAGDSTNSNTIRVTVNGCVASGYISAVGYAGIPGTQVQDLLNHPSYPDTPSISVNLSSFEYANAGNNYGAKLSGYICAPITGNYTFYIAGDDQAGLWLSTDDNPNNKVLIAYNVNPVGFRSWNTSSTQKSAPIRLVKGVRYYIETLHKQSSGTNHLSVRWTLPNGTNEAPIPGNRLSGFNIGSSIQPTSKSFYIDRSVSSGNDLLVYPNPFSVQTEVVIVGNKEEKYDLIVRNSFGLALEKVSNLNTGSRIKIGATIRTNGIYFMELIERRTGKRTVKKLVKK